MGYVSWSGPPSCGDKCKTCDCPPCSCGDGLPTATAANGMIGDTGAPGGIGGGSQGAPLGQGTPTCASPGQVIGEAGTSTTRIKMKGSPGLFSGNISETSCLSIPLRNGLKLRLAWVRLGGIDLGYGDNFWPAGMGAIWSF